MWDDFFIALVHFIQPNLEAWGYVVTSEDGIFAKIY